MGSRRIQIKVKPNAPRSRLVETEDGPWTAFLNAPPVDGKANGELIKLLAKRFGVPKAAVTIRLGQGSRQKLVEIEGIEETD
jgi:uncharacterized protein (TIGR00251 family)